MTKKKKSVTEQLAEDKQLIEYKTRGVVLMTQEEAHEKIDALFAELELASTPEEEDRISREIATIVCSARYK